MNDESSRLPWDALQHTDGGIPWPALRTFAEAVATDREVARELFDLYERGHQAVLHETCYADLYVPAIFAMAAPKLNDEQRDTIGAFLLHKLAEAGRADDGLGLEVLTAAVGTLGPAILPAVLDTIAKEPDTRGAWIFLWSLTVLAAETDDPALRDPVVHRCVELLERVDRAEFDLDDAHSAAWTLGLLQRTEHTDLLRRLAEKAKRSFVSGDYAASVKLLEGGVDDARAEELWERPVEDWLGSSWKTARDWFAKREAGDTGDVDEQDHQEGGVDMGSSLARLVAMRFLCSPVAVALPPELRADAFFITSQLLTCSLQYLDMHPRDWDEAALRELLLEIIPRNVPAEVGMLEKIVPAAEAFLAWLGAEGLLADTEALARTVRGWHEEIVAAGMNPDNWSPIKAFVMRAKETGIDAGDPQVRRAFVDEQVRDVLGHAEWAEPEPTAHEPPIPIVETASKIGRNAPCPCGSGRKYKKCCAKPAARDATGK